MPRLSDFLLLAKEGSWQVHLCRDPIWTLFSGGLFHGRLLLDNSWPCATPLSCLFLAFLSLSVWPRVVGWPRCLSSEPSQCGILVPFPLCSEPWGGHRVLGTGPRRKLPGP